MAQRRRRRCGVMPAMNARSARRAWRGVAASRQHQKLVGRAHEPRHPTGPAVGRRGESLPHRDRIAAVRPRVIHEQALSLQRLEQLGGFGHVPAAGRPRAPVRPSPPPAAARPPRGCRCRPPARSRSRRPGPSAASPSSVTPSSHPGSANLAIRSRASSDRSATEPSERRRRSAAPNSSKPATARIGTSELRRDQVGVLHGGAHLHQREPIAATRVLSRGSLRGRPRGRRSGAPSRGRGRWRPVGETAQRGPPTSESTRSSASARRVVPPQPRLERAERAAHHDVDDERIQRPARGHRPALAGGAVHGAQEGRQLLVGHLPRLFTREGRPPSRGDSGDRGLRAGAATRGAGVHRRAARSGASAPAPPLHPWAGRGPSVRSSARGSDARTLSCPPPPARRPGLRSALAHHQATRSPRSPR